MTIAVKRILAVFDHIKDIGEKDAARELEVNMKGMLRFPCVYQVVFSILKALELTRQQDYDVIIIPQKMGGPFNVAQFINCLINTDGKSPPFVLALDQDEVKEANLRTQTECVKFEQGLDGKEICTAALSAAILLALSESIAVAVEDHEVSRQPASSITVPALAEAVVVVPDSAGSTASRRSASSSASRPRARPVKRARVTNASSSEEPGPRPRTGPAVAAAVYPQPPPYGNANGMPPHGYPYMPPPMNMHMPMHSYMSHPHYPHGAYPQPHSEDGHWQQMSFHAQVAFQQQQQQQQQHGYQYHQQPYHPQHQQAPGYMHTHNMAHYSPPPPRFLTHSSSLDAYSPPQGLHGVHQVDLRRPAPSRSCPASPAPKSRSKSTNSTKSGSGSGSRSSSNSSSSSNAGSNEMVRKVSANNSPKIPSQAAAAGASSRNPLGSPAAVGTLLLPRRSPAFTAVQRPASLPMGQQNTAEQEAEEEEEDEDEDEEDADEDSDDLLGEDFRASMLSPVSMVDQSLLDSMFEE